jgi:hypothetical protein
MAALLKMHLTGGAANADPNLSLGGVSSSVELSATALNSLFDNVSADEAAAGDVEYRAIDVKNSGDASAVGVQIYMNPATASASTELDLGIEASPLGSTLSIANESTAPAGVTFSHYNSATRLSLPDIAAPGYCRVWVRRTVTTAAPNLANDTGTLNVDYA